jgi:hypothetical protein
VTTRLLVLLVLLTVLPAMGMLWLMNRAVAMETTAGQQQVLEHIAVSCALCDRGWIPYGGPTLRTWRKVAPRQSNGSRDW